MGLQMGKEKIEAMLFYQKEFHKKGIFFFGYIDSILDTIKKTNF